MKKKLLLISMFVLSLALLVAAGSTIAWLIDESDEVKNVFTPSNIDIELTETKKDFQMVPGNTIEKDPKVTVKAGSVDCWLFIKIVESGNLNTYIEYSVAEGWTAVPDQDGFYYREAKEKDSFSILAGDQVTVLEEVTKAQMDALYNNDGSVNEEACPTLTFYAAAIQKANVEDYNAAWDALPDDFKGTN